MNCRIMEEKVFPRPAVAGALTQGFIESRIHTDHADSVINERNAALQERLVQTKAMPTYIIVNADGEPVSEIHQLKSALAGLDGWAEDFVEFLQQASR